MPASDFDLNPITGGAGGRIPLLLQVRHVPNPSGEWPGSSPLPDCGTLSSCLASVRNVLRGLPIENRKIDIAVDAELLDSLALPPGVECVTNDEGGVEIRTDRLDGLRLIERPSVSLAMMLQQALAGARSTRRHEVVGKSSRFGYDRSQFRNDSSRVENESQQIKVGQ